MPSVKPVPDGHHALTPYLIVDDAAGAIAFYTRAFGAHELYRMPGPDGRVMHAEIVIGDSPLMLTDADPNRFEDVAPEEMARRAAAAATA